MTCFLICFCVYAYANVAYLAYRQGRERADIVHIVLLWAPVVGIFAAVIVPLEVLRYFGFSVSGSILIPVLSSAGLWLGAYLLGRLGGPSQPGGALSGRDPLAVGQPRKPYQSHLKWRDQGSGKQTPTQQGVLGPGKTRSLRV
jgi:hypothetical protein